MTDWKKILDRAEELKAELKPTWGNRGDITGEAILLARFEAGELKTLPAWLDFGGGQ